MSLQPPLCSCKAATKVYENAFLLAQEVGSMKALENAHKCFNEAMEAMNNCPVHGVKECRC